jgi:hypothetical protein
VILVKDVWTFKDDKDKVFRNGGCKVGIVATQAFSRAKASIFIIPARIHQIWNYSTTTGAGQKLQTSWKPRCIYVAGIICGKFQNQPPIGWLKKYKIENKTLLYGTVTYVTAVLLQLVAIHIYVLVIP